MAFLEFAVAGEPYPQPRPRARARNIRGRMTAVFHDDRSDPVHAWKAELAVRAREARPPAWPLDAAYRVLVVLTVARPASAGSREAVAGSGCHRKPDLDNYVKAVCDALTGSLWADDGKVYDCRAVKVYGDSPGVRVLVQAVPPGADACVAGVIMTWQRHAQTGFTT